MKEWPTKSVCDAFFASPKFPRLLSVEAIRQAIQNGVANGFFAFVDKSAKGDYEPILFQKPLMTGDIEFSEEMFLVKKIWRTSIRKSGPTASTRSQRPIPAGPKRLSKSANQRSRRKPRERRQPSNSISPAWFGRTRFHPRSG